MKKSPEITDATRNKLIQAFCEIYKEKPISKITVKEITDIAGYNRCTFYQYFQDIYALLEYAESEMIATGLEKINALRLESSDFDRQFVLSLSDVLHEHDYYSVLLLRSGVGSDFFRKIKEYIIPVMMKRYHVSEENTRAVFCLEYCLSGMLTVLTHWLERPEDLTTEEFGTLIHGIWCDGPLVQLKE
ncbi:MAG: TetR/AcrR family transcriptional regulator [Oscillospiraceae bacterium]|nr:TetR/AcrR family transcriptional regulator [Oscillospiraceae bacterium]